MLRLLAFTACYGSLAVTACHNCHLKNFLQLPAVFEVEYLKIRYFAYFVKLHFSIFFRREFFASSLYGLFVQQKCFHNDVSYIYRDMCEYVLIKLKQD
jgi:hypothetical protein